MAYRSESGELFRFDASSCKYPGCTRPRYCEPTGFIHEFCGRTHAIAYSQLMSAPKSLDFKFKRQSQSKKSSQGHGKPLVANHKLDNVTYTSKTASTTSSAFNPGYSSDIKFYHRFQPYYEFTNFAQYPIQLDGKLWPTTEHYFQAQKFVGTPYEEAIRRQPNARGAFDMSRNPSVSYWRRGDWDQVKNDIMLKCLRAKFTQHRSLRKSLLDTGHKQLIEHTSNDSYWGDGGDGSGENKLGKLLMQVRREIQDTISPTNFTVPYRSSSACDSDYKGNPLKENVSSSYRHRRRNSFSGSLNTISSLESKHDKRSIKHQRSNSYSNIAATNSHPECESCFQTSLHSSRLNSAALSSQYKRTTLPSNGGLSNTRSSSYGDLYQLTRCKSNPVHTYNSGSDFCRTKPIPANSLKKQSITKSSVSYNIISNI